MTPPTTTTSPPPRITGHTAELDRLRVHYLTAGAGDPVVLLHGVPQTSHMWRPVITTLATRYRVIAADLRGAGGTQVTETGYDKASMAADVDQLLGHLDATDNLNVIGHDMGAAVAYAYAAAHPEQVRRLGFMEFLLAGFGFEQAAAPAPDHENWQLGFFASAPDMAERLLLGRERELLSWYFNHGSDDPHAIGARDFEFYLRELSKPGALRATIRYFAACWADAEHNRTLADTPLPMPVLAVGGARSARTFPQQSMANVADRVRGVVVDDAGHWLVDEQPDVIAELLTEFLR